MKNIIFIFLMFFCLSLTLYNVAAQSKKKTVAVLEFNSSSTEIGKNELTTLSNRFRSILVKTDAFTVLERGKMNDILKEQNFVLSDNCNSAECAVQIGQLLGVELMIAGDIGKLGSTYSIDLRIIDVSSGQIVRTETQDHDGKIDGLFRAMADIANSFAGIKAANHAMVTNDGSSTNGQILENETFTDPRDGQIYKTVKIGNQTWMAENLRYKTLTGSWCYDDDPVKCEMYGRSFDWETAKKVAPPGWHLPSMSEFEQMLSYLGGDAKTAYKKLIQGGSSKFNVLFGGWRTNGYGGLGSNAYFWSSTEDDIDYARFLSVGSVDQEAYVDLGIGTSAVSVRCVKD